LLPDVLAEAPAPPPPIIKIVLDALFQSPGVVNEVPDVIKYAFTVEAAKSMPELLPEFVELAPAYQLYGAVPFVTNGVNDRSRTFR
jgi:hypothetical protein